MTGEQENGVNYAKAVSDAWTEFVDKHGFSFSDMHTEQSDKIGKAFMAGWITGIGSINGNSAK